MFYRADDQNGQKSAYLGLGLVLMPPVATKYRLEISLYWREC